jgi:hypothetical protein
MVTGASPPSASGVGGCVHEPVPLRTRRVCENPPSAVAVPLVMQMLPAMTMLHAPAGVCHCTSLPSPAPSAMAMWAAKVPAVSSGTALSKVTVASMAPPLPLPVPQSSVLIPVASELLPQMTVKSRARPR